MMELDEIFKELTAETNCPMFVEKEHLLPDGSARIVLGPAPVDTLEKAVSVVNAILNSMLLKSLVQGALPQNAVRSIWRQGSPWISALAGISTLQDIDKQLSTTKTESNHGS